MPQNRAELSVMQVLKFGKRGNHVALLPPRGRVKHIKIEMNKKKKSLTSQRPSLSKTH